MPRSPWVGKRSSVLASLGVVVLSAATTILVTAAPAFAATTTLYASPAGSGSSCSASQPCSLAGAQSAVRSMVGSMSGDIVVQLADGVYRVTSPLDVHRG